jgi:cytoskeletal protein CcmA (bactofilin family)
VVRSFCAIILLALLCVPIHLRADDHAQPVSPDGKCLISADEDWRPQERFVWEHVCVGEDANFNNTPDYGGDIDPRKPEGLPASRVLRSSFLEAILLKNKYRRGLTRRGVRIVGAHFVETLDLEGAELRHPLFLTRSFFKDGINFRRLKSAYLISFDGSNIAGTLNMDELRLDARLTINGARLSINDDNAKNENIILTNARVDGNVDLARTHVTGKVDMDGLHVGANLVMDDESSFVDLILENAHIGGNFVLERSSVSGDFEMSRLHVDGHLFANEVQFTKVSLVDARIDGSLVLDRAEVKQNLDMNGLHVGKNLLMRDNAMFTDVFLPNAQVAGNLGLERATVAGELNMDGARVGSNLVLNSAHVAGKLVMNRIHVGAHLFANSANFTQVTLLDAHIEGIVALDGTKMIQELDMNGLHVGAHLLMRKRKAATHKKAAFTDKAVFSGVVLANAHIGGNLELDGATVNGRLIMDNVRVGAYLFLRNAQFANVILSSAHVGGHIDLTSTIVNGAVEGITLESDRDVLLSNGIFSSVDLTLARIKGSLELAGGEFSKSINLSGVQIGGGLGLGSFLGGARWGNEGALILRSSTVDIIPSLADAWAPKLDLDGLTYRSVGAARSFEGWFEKLKPYSAQPYGQLALVVQNQGNSELATAIRYAGKDKERQRSTWLRWGWLTTLDAFIGYGYYPERALRWVVIFVALGTLFLSFSEQSGWNGLHSLASKVVFSTDILLPIIKLRERNYQIVLDGWLGYYFYLHKIMGYVLASFLIAGLSGLTK